MTLFNFLPPIESDLKTLVAGLKYGIKRNDPTYDKIFCYMPEDNTDIRKMQLIFQRRRIPTQVCKNTFSPGIFLALKIMDYRNISDDARTFADTLWTRLDEKRVQTYQATLATSIQDYVQTDDGWIFLYPYKLNDYNRVCDALVHSNIDAQKYMIATGTLPLDKLWDGWDNANRLAEMRKFIHTVKFPTILVQDKYYELSDSQRQLIDNIMKTVNDNKKRNKFYLKQIQMDHQK